MGNIKSKKGFTLVELIAVMAIITIVGGLAVTLLSTQNKWFGKVNKETRLQDEVRITLLALENDIRVGRAKVYNTNALKDSTVLDKVESINFGSGDKTLPSSILRAKEIMKFKRKDASGVEKNYAYVLKGKTLFLIREDGSILEVQTKLAENIVKIQIIERAKDIEIKLVLNNGDGEKEFNAIVSPRNS